MHAALLWQVANAVAAMQSLTRLHMLTLTVPETILPAINVMTQLQSLHMDYLQMQDDEDYSLFTHMSSLINLKSLRICDAKHVNRGELLRV
jgi:hypothetical protein